MTLIALIACNMQNPGQLALDPVGRIGGQVLDPSGAPVAGVVVSVDELSATTDDFGIYHLDGVDPGDDLVLEFRRSGYALNYKRAVILSWETIGVDAVISPIDGFGTFDATKGGNVSVGLVDVDFMNDSVVDAKTGERYTGSVRAEVTYLDPSTDDMLFSPGDMMAKGFQSDEEGGEYDEELTLVSYGMVDVSLFAEDGSELQLADGSPALVTIPITNNAVPSGTYHVQEGDIQELWSFDPETGVWLEEGVGTIIEEEDGLAFAFEAPHFTWWNADQGLIPTCASGYVYDMLGFAVRGARVTATGGGTMTTVYTDENGFYTLSVLAGATVTVNGSTWVADQNWDASKSHFVDCPSGSHFCDVTATGIEGACYPVDDIVIDVCRESGVVSADNMKWDISTGSGEGDGLRAWFWEAEGTPSLCTDPWEEMEDDECVVTTPEDYPEKFQLRTNGLESAGTRSAGSYVEFQTPRTSYRVEESSWDGNTVYEMQTIEIGKARFEQVEVDVRAGDAIFGNSPGSADDFFGPMPNEYWMTVPGDVTFEDEGAMGTLSRSSGLELDVEASDEGEELVVLVTGQPDEPALLCRSNDNTVEIGADDLSEMNSGWSSVSVYRPSTGWTLGPDGMPIRVQALSGRVAEIELQ